MEKRVVLLALCAGLCTVSIQAGDLRQKAYDDYTRQFQEETFEAVNNVEKILKNNNKKLSEKEIGTLQGQLKNYAKPGSTGVTMTQGILATEIFDAIKNLYREIMNAKASSISATTARKDYADNFFNRVKAVIRFDMKKKK